jgi:hypothetical protein
MQNLGKRWEGLAVNNVRIPLQNWLRDCMPLWVKIVMLAGLVPPNKAGLVPPNKMKKNPLTKLKMSLCC